LPRCCYTCANEKEIRWRIKIQQNIIQQQFDEKLNYLKSLQQSIANIPLFFYYLFCAISVYKYMINLEMNRALVYYSFLRGKENCIIKNQ
jgi:hypothetical protein